MTRKLLCYVLFFVQFASLAFIGPAVAKIDFATLTDRQSVQTTIYKKADLTLVRDSRILSFAKGHQLPEILLGQYQNRSHIPFA